MAGPLRDSLIKSYREDLDLWMKPEKKIVDDQNNIDLESTDNRKKDLLQCFFNTEMSSYTCINKYCNRASTPLFTNELLRRDLIRFFDEVNANEKFPDQEHAIGKLHKVIAAVEKVSYPQLAEHIYNAEMHALQRDYGVSSSSSCLSSVINKISRVFTSPAGTKSPEEVQETLDALKALIDNAKDKLRDEIEVLIPDRPPLLAPIGDARHFMFMEVSCTEVNGKHEYLFRIYNSTHNWMHGAVSRFDYINPWGKIPTLQIAGVKESILDSTFFSDIYDAAFFGAESPYDVIRRHLLSHGGTILPPDANRRHQPQGEFNYNCITKAGNFWLKESLGKDLYTQFKTSRVGYSIERLKSLKRDYEDSWVEKHLSYFVCRILYFLFNYMTLSAAIQSGENILNKRKIKHHNGQN